MFDSKLITGALGLVLIRAAQAIEVGVSAADLSVKIKEWLQKAGIRVSVQTLNYIIRSGRVSPMKSFIARTLDLKPVIALDKEGKAVLSGKSFTEKGCVRRVVKDIERMLHKNNLWGYAITHAGNAETADSVAAEMEKLTGKPPLYLDHASPVLVAHTGVGVVCVSYLME